MSKKDFVTFARMIRAQKHAINHPLLTPSQSEHESIIKDTSTRLLDTFVNELCDIFQNDNSQFNKAKFLQACEIND